MSIEEYIDRLEAFKEDIGATFLEFCVQAGMDAKALIQHRIQEAGDNADGAQLGVYTSESYKRKREKRGRQTEYVDLTMTRGGAGMFGSTGVVAESFDGNMARVSVSGTDAFTNDKLGWNSERYGDVLRLSAGEEALINKTFDDYLGEKARKHHLI